MLVVISVKELAARPLGDLRLIHLEQNGYEKEIDPDSTTDLWVLWTKWQHRADQVRARLAELARGNYRDYRVFIVGNCRVADFLSAIDFKLHPEPGYHGRTFQNAAQADETWDFAFTANGSGGRRGLTRLATEKAGSNYVWVTTKPDGFDPEDAAKCLISARENWPWATVNIAGHGITQMSCSQEKLDALVFETMRIVHKQTPIGHVRSGGQTGFDEAGVKAAARLNIQATVLAPRDWRYRPAGGDRSGNGPAFIARFE
jgi:hypothetical protein